MKTASITERFSDHVKASGTTPVVVMRKGSAVAVLIPVTDPDDAERLALAYSPKFQAMLQKSNRQIEKTGGIPHDEFWDEVEAESRAKSRRPRKGSGK